jgi:hypothetical protein
MMFQEKERGMNRSLTILPLGLVVLFAFVLSGGVFGAGFNLFDLATCTVRGGKVAGRFDPGGT